MVNVNIPTAAEVKGRLAALGYSEMQALAKSSGVPFTTLWKIRSGETPNPRIETVRLCYEALSTASREAAKAA